MRMICQGYHIPVMLRETVDGLAIRPHGVYVDVTFGGGGHSLEILRRIIAQGSGHLYSFDQDADAQCNIQRLVDEFGQQAVDDFFTFVHSNFRFLRNWMRYYGIEQIDGVLADLGVSSHHLDEQERGFSFRFDAPLDMRMNQRGGCTAADVVNTYSEKQLMDIMRLYGEVRQPQRVVRAIVKARMQDEIRTTGQLAKAVYPDMNITGTDGETTATTDRRMGEAKKELARVFQALRIEVNGEMNALRQMLVSAQDLLAPEGRLSVLTYHSLEDRMVKNIIKCGNTQGDVLQDVYGNVPAPMRAMGKALVPSDEEQAMNPRSRSAKLRIAEKR